MGVRGSSVGRAREAAAVRLLVLVAASLYFAWGMRRRGRSVDGRTGRGAPPINFNKGERA